MAMATIIVGDMNAHNQRWLRYSHSNTVEGKEQQNICGKMGLMEKVGQPTRGAYLLDLVLTDFLSGVSCKVLPEISDHKIVLSRVSLHVSLSEPVVREHWHFSATEWSGLCNAFSSTDWRDFFVVATPRLLQRSSLST